MKKIFLNITLTLSFFTSTQVIPEMLADTETPPLEELFADTQELPPKIPVKVDSESPLDISIENPPADLPSETTPESSSISTIEIPPKTKYSNKNSTTGMETLTEIISERALETNTINSEISPSEVDNIDIETPSETNISAIEHSPQQLPENESPPHTDYSNAEITTDREIFTHTTPLPEITFEEFPESDAVTTPVETLSEDLIMNEETLLTTDDSTEKGLPTELSPENPFEPSPTDSLPVTETPDFLVTPSEETVIVDEKVNTLLNEASISAIEPSKVVNQVNTNQKVTALTISGVTDDAHIDAILQNLAVLQTKATFFINGGTSQAAIRKIVAVGHDIGHRAVSMTPPSWRPPAAWATTTPSAGPSTHGTGPESRLAKSPTAFPATSRLAASSS